LNPGFYIAHIPIKYFQNMSVDLFPGKLFRGRVISVEQDKVKIELGGAQIDAKTSRVLQKGDIITLKVTGITKGGVSLEITDVIPKSQAKSIPQPQIPAKPALPENKEIESIRQSVIKLIQTTNPREKTIEQNSLSETLKNVLEPGRKYDFYFITFPIKLDDEKSRNFELLMRKVASDEENAENQTYELMFSVTTPRLGGIAGKLLAVGKQLRLDITSTSDSTVKELQTIADPLKKALTELGFRVSSINIRQGEIKTSIEQHLSAP
jgi:hypothetical protein